MCIGHYSKRDEEFQETQLYLESGEKIVEKQVE